MLAADLAAYCHFIAGKLATLDGPRRDDRGRIVYGLVINGQVQRWLRYETARKLADAHNAKVDAEARIQAKLVIEELTKELAEKATVNRREGVPTE